MSILSNQINISTYRTEFESQLLEIADLQFGKGYINQDELAICIQNPDTTILVASLEDQLIGFSIFEISDLKNTSATLRIDAGWFKKRFQKSNRFCNRKQTVIHPDYSRQGIGKKLLRTGMEIGLSKADILISMTWTKPSSYSISNLLLKNGFVKIKDFLDYWQEESLSKNYSCQICGTPPCRCSATLYVYFK